MQSLLLKQSFSRFAQDVWRNKWVSLGTVLAMSLVLLLTWLVIAINDSSQQVVDQVQEKVDIAVFFERDVPEFQITAFLEELEDLQEAGNIKSFEYYSEEYALEEMKKKFPEKVRFLERYQFENPLQASVEIVPGEWSPDEIISFASNPRLNEVIDQELFDTYEEKKEEVVKILQLLQFLRRSGAILVTVFLIISGLLVSFFLSALLQQKKREIFIMRLVGAEHMFIRMPFLFQGIALALSAFVISNILFFVVFESIVPSLIQSFSLSSDQVFVGNLLVSVGNGFWSSLWLYGILTFVVSLGISWFTVERFLQKRHLLAEE